MKHSDEAQAITVLLDDRGTDTKVRPFYCVVCGKCVCEIVGNVTGVVNGHPEDMDRAHLGTRVLKTCRGFYFEGNDRFLCNAKYAF